jgi:hypothetical protein
MPTASTLLKINSDEAKRMDSTLMIINQTARGALDGARYRICRRVIGTEIMWYTKLRSRDLRADSA